MCKRVMKTIILIVFVVFVGIKNVSAKDSDIYKTCIYSNGKKELTMSISTAFEVQSTSDDKKALDKILNWKTDNSSGFSGYQYFKDNNYSCPPYLVQFQWAVDNDWDGALSDEASLDEVKKYGKGKADVSLFGWKVGYDDEVYELSATHFGAGYYEENSEELEEIGNVTTTKNCKCSNDDDSFKFSISANLTQPKVDFKKDVGKESILNWSERLKGTSYTFLSDYSVNNSCPAYIIQGIGTFGGNYAYASDAANYEDILKEVKDEHGRAYTYTCKEVGTSTSENNTGNSNSNINPGYVDPETPSIVGIGSPLNSDLSTYSCGAQTMVGIPGRIIKMVRFIYNFLQFLVPISIIILGSIDLLKSIIAQKEDEIKKGYQTLIKRLITAIIVFFVLAIVKFLVSVIGVNTTGVVECVDCFLQFNDSCKME